MKLKIGKNTDNQPKADSLIKIGEIGKSYPNTKIVLETSLTKIEIVNLQGFSVNQ